MSESSKVTPESSSSPDGKAKSEGALGRIFRSFIYLVLIMSLGAAAYAGYQASQAKKETKAGEADLVSKFGLTDSNPKHLAPMYTDKAGRLMADPPTDASQLQNPDTLVVAYDEDTDTDSQPIDWDGFRDFLAAATGKKVTIQEYSNTVEDIANVKAGKIQIVALHAADAPYVVNNAGFIPVAVLGDSPGAANGNRLDIATPASSPIQTLADIKGHNLTCSTPISITGYRAAIAALLEKAQLRPDVDYTVNFSLGQKKSIKGLIKGEFEVASISDDKLQSMLKSGKVKESEYHVLYQSEVIPRLTVGYVYNLQPDLAAKVVQAITDFKNEKGTPDEGTNKQMRFYAVDYKKDFEFVRRIDDAFDPRFGAKNAKDKSKPGEEAKPAEAPTTAPAPANG